MITLITGTPGSGKTLYAVWNEIKKANEAGRTVYCSGIPKLKLPTVQLSDDEVHKWYEISPFANHDIDAGVPDLANIETGSLIVIDEVQRLWRPTGSGAQVPPDIAGLETHRHHGLDFVIISQYPSLVHRNVRALVGKHIHLRSTALGTYAYEFPEWSENPATRSARVACVKSRYKLPKAAFNLYESASLHVKNSKRKPAALYIGLAMVLLLPVLGYFGYRSSHKLLHPEILPSVISSASAAPGIHPATSSLAVPAPVYQDVTMVSNQYDWSKIGACVVMHGKCTCYGDHANRLSLPETVCRAGVAYGWQGRDALPSSSSATALPVGKEAPTTQEEKRTPSVSVHYDGSPMVNIKDTARTDRYIWPG